MANTRWIKNQYGDPKNRMALHLDSVDIMASNMAPRLHSMKEAHAVSIQFMRSLEKYCDFPLTDQTS